MKNFDLMLDRLAATKVRSAWQKGVRVYALELLVLDQEWKGCKQFNIKPGVYCRVLIDGWYRDSFTAESRDQAIEKFMNTNWR